MTATFIMPLVRHGAGWLGGYLVAKGHLDPAMTETLVGVILGASALIMSYLDPVKKKA